MVRVLIVDDEPLVRASLQAGTDWEKHGIIFVRDASNGEQAMAVLEQEDVDIVLLDMSMPRCDGICFLRRLSKSSYKPVVVVLSAYDEFSLVREAFTLGAADYILKADMTGETVLQTLLKASEHVTRKSRGDNDQIKQQLLKDLLNGEPPENIRMLLDSIGMQFSYPLLPCELRYDPGDTDSNKLSESVQKKRDTVMQYLKKTLEPRDSGEFVILQDNRAAWLIQDAMADPEEMKLHAEKFLKDLSELTAQVLNASIVWAFGEPARDFASIPRCFSSASLLFGVNSRLVRRAKAYIRRHYRNPDLSLADVSHYAGVSRTHLSAQFSRECGVGFSDYLTSVRIEAAKMLLERSPRKIYEIAEDVGYRSVEHFSRTFKKVTGFAPKSYSG